MSAITDYLKRLIVAKLGTADDESSEIISNIVDNGAGGGGGGSVLSLTFSKNEEDKYVLSKTWQEIYDALNHGQIVVLVNEEENIDLSLPPNTIQFCAGVLGKNNLPNAHYSVLFTMTYEWTCGNATDYPVFSS